MNSLNYRDYVIKNGKLVGEFDKMYQNSQEVPWHQDKTAFTLFTEIDLSIIKYYNKGYKFQNICEIGCGYGYITNRLKNEIFVGKKSKVSGFDVSSTAIEKASKLFPNIKFIAVDMLNDNLKNYNEAFDFLYIKDVLWYVVDKIDIFKDNLDKILSKNGYIYIMNAVPDLESFFGQDTFPNTFSIIDYFSKFFEVVYANSTYEIDKNRVFGEYSKDKYVRILLKKRS